MMDLIDRQEVLAETGKWLNDLLEDDSASDIRVGIRMVRVYMKQMSAVKPVDKDINVSCKDAISRQMAIDICHKNYDGILDFKSDGWTVASSFEDIINSVPPVHPTYTDAEILKIQDMEQAEIEKAFDLGREDTQAEIIHCKDCRWQNDQSGSTAWLPCRVLVTPGDFY